MSIRLRLALCYGALFVLILTLVTSLGYAIHARSQYDDLDRGLVTSAGHAAADLSTFAHGPLLFPGHSQDLVLRLYSADGQLKDSSLGAELLPLVDPRIILHRPSGPAYDAFVKLVPPLLMPSPMPSDGTFGLLSASEERWRVYILPVHHAATISSYVEALTPLGQLDASLQSARIVLLMLCMISACLALLSSWAVAGNALKPINTMVETAHAIALSRDLSRRVPVPRHRDELAHLATTFNEMLKSVERSYRAQNRFVSDASHELRTPLTAIQANLELLRMHQHMPQAERAEVLAEVERETHRLSRLVADLLALAHADAGTVLKHGLVDLDAVVLDVYRSVRQLAQGHILLLHPFMPVQINGHEDRLKQLLFILLDNALKYTPVGGTITLGICSDERQVTMTVSDTGIGITAADLPHVFERFYRADSGRSRDPGGTGLGLSIAQWIVEQHGGTITMTSQQDQGTQVVVCFNKESVTRNPQSSLSQFSAIHQLKERR